MPVDPVRLKAVFSEALLKTDPTDRVPYLDAACAGDAALRSRVEALLRASEDPDSLLDAAGPAVPLDAAVPTATFGRNGSAAHTADHAPTPEAGAVVAGKYKLLQQIGEGGMGTVWMAQQTEPVKRRVAVKLVRAERGASRTILSRFEAERQAIALMNHPNIANLLDAGTTEAGTPFFVMELVKGVPLTDYCDAHKLSVPERLDLFRQICSAVHHAHQKGVIHRDLKPTNILVESHDGKPVPKVIDFGLAKATTGLQLTEHTLFTAFGTVAGTPLYMAPEQATFNAVDVDSRADIYALGVILYELLSGSTPIHKDTLRTAALDEMLRVIREQEPPPPSSRISTSVAAPGVAAARQSEPVKLGRYVRGELDWIVMKALAKERERRYESATALAADVGRFLAHEPVTAGPPSQWYRLRKFVRRNKGRVAAAAAVLLALVAGVVGTSLGLLEANRATERALAEEQKAVTALTEKEKALHSETDAKNELLVSNAAERQAAYDMTIPQVQRALEEGDQPRAAKLLASCPEGLRGWEWNYLNRQFDRNALLIRPSFGPGRIGFDATYPTPDGRELLVLTAHPLGLLAQRWETATGNKKSEVEITPPSTHGFHWYAVSPDRRLVAVWDPPTNFVKRRGEKVDPRVPETVPGLARSVRVYDLHTAALVGELRGHTNWVCHVIFSSDSKQLVTGSFDRTIRFWSPDGQPGVVLRGHTKTAAVPLSFTPDDRMLLTAGRDFKASSRDGNGIQRNLAPEQATRERDEWFAWDLETQEPRTKGELAGVPLENFVGFDPNLSVSADGHYAILPDWVFSTVVDLATGKRAVPLGWHTEPIGFLRERNAVLLLGGAGVISVFDLTAGKTDRTFRLSIPTAEVLENLLMGNGTHTWNWNLSRDGRVLVIGRDGERKSVIVETATGREIGFVADKRSAYIPGNKPFVDGRNRDRVIADDASFFTSSDNYGEIKLWPLGPVGRVFDPSRIVKEPDGRVGSTLRGSKVVSPDGRRVLSQRLFRETPGQGLGAQVQFEIHDRASGERVVVGPRCDADSLRHLQFDRDGRRVVGLIVNRLRFDSKSQFESRGEYTPVIWDATNGQELVRGKPSAAPTSGRTQNLPQLAVSDTGAVLVASFLPEGRDAPAFLQKGHWQIEELGSGRPSFAFTPQSGRAFQFGPGAKLGVFFEHLGDGNAIELWDLERHEIIWTIPSADNPHRQTHGVFSEDGKRLFTFDGRNLSSAEAYEIRESVSVTVWDIPGKKKVASFNPPAEVLTTWPRPIDHEGTRLLCGDTVWNATTGRALVQLSDDRFAYQPRSQFRRGLDPDYVNELLAQTQAGTWKPTRQVGSMIAEARSHLMESRGQYDPSKAVELAREAVQAYPSDPLTIGTYGEALRRAGRPGEAIPLLEKALRLHDRYNTVQADGHALCFQLAMALHAVGRDQDARARFTEGVARHIMLIAAREYRPGDFRPDSGERPLEAPHPSMIEAARLLGVAVPSLDLGAITRDSDVRLREALLFRAMRHEREGRTAEAIALGEECVANEPLTPILAYNAACLFALAGQKAKADPAAQARYADRAVALLKRSVALGWDDVEYLKADDDLRSLRGRDDFKALVTGLERNAPRVPEPAPAPGLKR